MTQKITITEAGHRDGPEIISPVQMFIDLLAHAFQIALRSGPPQVESVQRIHTNLLKINGFPVGEIDPVAYLQALELSAGPECSPSAMDQAAMKACAGVLSTPYLNGVYKGRIAEIDPTRFNANIHYEQPYHRDDHNLTNIRQPSLNDEEGGEDQEIIDGVVEVEGPTGIPQKLLLSLAPEYDEQVDNDPEVLELIDVYNSLPLDEYSELQGIMSRGSDPISMWGYDAVAAVAVAAARGLTAKESKWWRSLSPKAKKTYLQKHPNSKYSKAYKMMLAAKRKKNKGRRVEEKTQKFPANMPPLPERFEELDEDQEAEASDLADKIEAEAAAQDEADEEAGDPPDEDEDEEDGDDEEDTSDEDEEEQDDMPEEQAERLHDAARRPGFLSSIVGSVKKSVKKSSVAAMGRFFTGKMEDGDQQKVVKGLSLIAGTLAVVAVGVGVSALAGPGVAASFVNAYVTHRGGLAGGGEGFDFGGGNKDDDEGAGDDFDGFDFSGDASAIANLADEDYVLQAMGFLDLSPVEAADGTDKILGAVSKDFVKWIIMQNSEPKGDE